MPIESYEVVLLDEPITVYNFHVEDFECYYVSGQRVLVHNTYNGDKKADDIISKERKASIRSKFPKEWLDKTLDEIEKAAKNGDDKAKTAKKLLKDNRF